LTKGVNIEEIFSREKDFSLMIEDWHEVDKQFHNDIIRACDSNHLVTLINNLQDSVQMSEMREVSFRSPERIKNSMAEHLKIIKAIKEKNEKLAEELAREHFQRTMSYYESHVE